MSSAAQIHREGAFALHPHVCAFRGKGGCYGRLQAHHPIERQTIRQARSAAIATGKLGHPLLAVDLDTILADARNSQLVCQRHHHSPYLTVTRADLPQSVEAFAADYQLEHRLDRDYGPLEAAA